MTARPRRANGGKALRLAYWNADGVCGKKLELDQFISEYGVNICLLNETHLESGRAFRFANYVCHRMDRQARGGGTAILVRRDIDHYAVPVSVPGHRHTPSVGKQASENRGGLPLTYPTPDRVGPERVSEWGSPSLDGGRSQRETHGLSFSVDHDQGRAPADYANRNACLIYGPDSPTTVPYQQNANPDVLDIVLVKDFVLPVHLTVCPALSSDHLPVLIDTMCRTSYRNLLDSRFQANGLGGMPGLP
jgi:hypothetical protein